MKLNISERYSDGRYVIRLADNRSASASREDLMAFVQAVTNRLAQDDARDALQAAEAAVEVARERLRALSPKLRVFNDSGSFAPWWVETYPGSGLFAAMTHVEFQERRGTTDEDALENEEQLHERCSNLVECQPVSGFEFL